jgi:hypothetical protein
MTHGVVGVRSKGEISSFRQCSSSAEVGEGIEADDFLLDPS